MLWLGEWVVENLGLTSPSLCNTHIGTDTQPSGDWVLAPGLLIYPPPSEQKGLRSGEAGNV